jgi:hypothetical protein
MWNDKWLIWHREQQLKRTNGKILYSSVEYKWIKCNINGCSITCCLITIIVHHDYGITELLHLLQLFASPYYQASSQWQQFGNAKQMGRDPTL